jgi:Immunoglobulin domain
LAPSFRKYPLPANIYGVLGGNVTLMCQPEAAPVATKQWFKDGNEFTGSSSVNDRVALLPNGNIHITGLQQSDLGNYTCLATNIYGSDSTSGNLSVMR